jgi:hypothetical protein
MAIDVVELAVLGIAEAAERAAAGRRRADSRRT